MFSDVQVPPHLFAISDTAYRNMLSKRELPLLVKMLDKFCIIYTYKL